MILRVTQFGIVQVSIGVLFCSLIFVSSVSAQIRTSPNYQLQSDSINVGGGLSSSTNFIQESTVGEVATGPSDSASFSLRAGYQQMQEVFLSLSGVADVLMTPDIPGVTGGQSNGSTTFTVITDSPAGYSVTIEAENDPAMQAAGAATIANHAFSESAAFVTTSSGAAFGLTVDGVDIAPSFLSSVGVCGSGSDEIDTCWSGVPVTAKSIASSASANHPIGATTTVHFRVVIDNGAAIDPGTYIATTTITALPL